MFQRSNLSLVCCVLPANCYNLRSYWFQITDKPDTTAVNPWRRLERRKYWASENRSVSSAQVPRTRTAHTRARSANWGESPSRVIRVCTEPRTDHIRKCTHIYLDFNQWTFLCCWMILLRNRVCLFVLIVVFRNCADSCRAEPRGLGSFRHCATARSGNRRIWRIRLSTTPI